MGVGHQLGHHLSHSHLQRMSLTNGNIKECFGPSHCLRKAIGILEMKGHWQFFIGD